MLNFYQFRGDNKVFITTTTTTTTKSLWNDVRYTGIK